MRDYGKVSPQFWIGKTGRSLRGNPDAQLVALYLMTSPHATMIGVYHCPVAYIAYETGLPLEGASKGLQSLSEAGFCTYSADTETVWVHEMARYQIADQLSESDNRVKGIQKDVENIADSEIRRGFQAKYGAAFHLASTIKKAKGLARGSKAPPKPGTGTGAGTGEDISLTGFAEFWSEYPKRVSKAQAERAWSKLSPDESLQAEIIASVRAWKATAQWAESDGKFVPYPATWLNAGGWQDEIPKSAEFGPKSGRPKSKLPPWVLDGYGDRDAWLKAKANNEVTA